MSGMLGRLYRGETTFNFVGRRWWGFGISIAFVVVTFVSLFAQGLNLGIDFKGGVAWEVPATTITIEDVRTILEANNIPTADAKIQILSGADGKRIRAQVGEISTETRTVVQTALSAKAQVDVQEVSVASVSSSWGRSITEKAVRALLIFFVIVSMYIAWRFEWKMAIAAILAMVHDVLISVGVYATFGFSVTPATVIAFLTILGFSLYDTIVVFDKVHENTTRYSASKVSYGDIVNVSSMGVHMAAFGVSAYSASKAALEFFTEGLYVELGKTNVRAHLFVPGTTASEFSTDKPGNNAPFPSDPATTATSEEVAISLLASLDTETFITYTGEREAQTSAKRNADVNAWLANMRQVFTGM